MDGITPHDIQLNVEAFQRAARLSGIPEDKIKWPVLGKPWIDSRDVPRGDNLDDKFAPLRIACRARHYSPRTERGYEYWVRRFLVHQSTRAAGLADTDAVRSFLELLVVNDQVAASTQAQALNALAFWCKEVLGRESAMVSPMVVSLFAEIEPTCGISFLSLIGLESFFRALTTASTP